MKAIHIQQVFCILLFICKCVYCFSQPPVVLLNKHLYVCINTACLLTFPTAHVHGSTLNYITSSSLQINACSHLKLNLHQPPINRLKQNQSARSAGAMATAPQGAAANQRVLTSNDSTMRGSKQNFLYLFLQMNSNSGENENIPCQKE